MSKWKDLRHHIAPNNTPLLVYGGYKNSEYFICVAEYCPKNDLFLVIPRDHELRNIWVDYWMELPENPPELPHVKKSKEPKS